MYRISRVCGVPAVETDNLCRLCWVFKGNSEQRCVLKTRFLSGTYIVIILVLIVKHTQSNNLVWYNVSFC